jgi:hypothetical protein
MAGQSCPGIINYRSFGEGGIESERASSLLFEGGLLAELRLGLLTTWPTRPAILRWLPAGAIRRYFPSWRVHRVSAI